MSRYIWAYLATAVVFLVLDLLWLGFVARGFYRGQMGPLLSEHPRLSAAVAFYALYVLGAVIFAVAAGVRTGSWTQASMFGALFGFFAYATYDLTNLAVVSGWPIALTFVDLAWGTILTAVASTCGYLVATWTLR